MISLSKSWARSVIVTVLMAGTWMLLEARERVEIVPQHQHLSQFPQTLGEWRGKDLSLENDVLQILGPGDFLFRDYLSPTQPESVNLFIAFFASQRTGDTIHSPKNCLPGEGWSALESGHILLNGPGKAAIQVNRYLVEAGEDRAVVLYWYQAHGRVVSNEYWAKFYLVIDSIRMGRSDGSMIRVFAPVQANGDTVEAETRAIQFAEKLMPVLDNYIPR